MSLSLQNTSEIITRIDSDAKTVQKCFKECLYEVPNFQRPYSWENDQLLDFWNDVVLGEGELFFGSTVTWESEKRELFNNTYSIIDGQQRLTTITIVLSVIRDFFYQFTDNDSAVKQAYNTQSYIITEDDNGTEYPVLKRPEDMFYSAIQNRNAIPSTEKWNSSAKRIGIARKFFEDKITTLLNTLASDEDKIQYLKDLRGNILKTRLIQVELDSEEDGFLVFETLNTRGSDLRLADLIKNLLIRGGAQNDADRDTISKRWESLLEKALESNLLGNSFDTIDRFIWQSWNSRRQAVKMPEIFKELSQMVNNSPDKHISYIEELEVDSKIYSYLHKEDITPQTKNSVRNAFTVPEFVDSVRALAVFDISVANSALLAIARKYNEESKLVTQADLIEVGRLIENFHFQFSAMTNGGSTGGTRSRYNNFAVSLTAANTKKEISNAIKDLQERLKNSLPDRSRVKEEFKKLFYSPELNIRQHQKKRARKAFIAYVLSSFAKSCNAIPSGIQPISWSIEHILPQECGDDKTANPVYSIGNLTLISEKLNSQLSSYEFKRKSPELHRKSAYFDDCLLEWENKNVTNVTPELIFKRSEHLACLAVDEVWKI